MKPVALGTQLAQNDVVPVAPDADRAVMFPLSGADPVAPQATGMIPQEPIASPLTATTPDTSDAPMHNGLPDVSLLHDPAPETPAAANADTAIPATEQKAEAPVTAPATTSDATMSGPAAATDVAKPEEKPTEATAGPPAPLLKDPAKEQAAVPPAPPPASAPLPVAKEEKMSDKKTPPGAAQAAFSDPSGNAQSTGDIAPTRDASADAAREVAFMESLNGSQSDLITLDIAAPGMTPDISGSVSMPEAVAFALKNNFSALAAAAKTKQTYWEKIGSYSQYGPSIEYNWANGRERSEPSAYNDPSGNRVLDDSHSRTDTTLSVRQPLIDLSVIADILTSHNTEDAAKDDQRDVREGLAYDTINVYLKLLQARLSIQLADEYKGYLDDLSSRMKARVEGGGATAGDLDRIRGRASNAESARIEAVGEYESDLAEFQRLTQITPAQLKIPDRLMPEIPDNVQVALDRAVAANPAYLSSIDKSKAAINTRNKSFADLAPKLSVEYSHVNTWDAGGAAKGDPIDGVYPTQNDERVMLVAHWALYGGTQLASGAANVQRAYESRFQSWDTRSRLEQSIRTSYNAISSAVSRTDTLRNGIEANARVVKEFEDQYKNGGRSLFELLDAHEQLYNSRLNMMRTTIAKAQAAYQVRRQMGELVAAIMNSEKQ